jgi:hypothetical protein
MGGAKNAVVAILAILAGAGLGLFWNHTRPADGIEMAAGVGLIGVVLIYFALISIGKH